MSLIMFAYNSVLNPKLKFSRDGTSDYIVGVGGETDTGSPFRKANGNIMTPISRSLVAYQNTGSRTRTTTAAAAATTIAIAYRHSHT